MSDQRLRGQEAEIRIMRDGVMEASITMFTNMDDTAKFEKKEDGFLGETTNRYDFIFNGYDGKVEFQVHDTDWIKLQNAIKAKAMRKNVNTVINIVRTDYYANGQTAVITYMDLSFGPMPTTIPSRGDFVKVSMDFSCSDRDEQLLNSIL